MKKMLLPVIVCCALLLTGCETYDAVTTGVNLSSTNQTGIVNDDKIVVNTEKALYIATDTFDLFLLIERNHEASLKTVNPQIHVYAEKIRANGKNWITSAEVAKDAYKHNRTALNHANLITAYHTLNTAIKESKKYTELAKTK